MPTLMRRYMKTATWTQKRTTSTHPAARSRSISDARAVWFCSSHTIFLKRLARAKSWADMPKFPAPGPSLFTDDPPIEEALSSDTALPASDAPSSSLALGALGTLRSMGSGATLLLSLMRCLRSSPGRGDDLPPPPNFLKNELAERPMSSSSLVASRAGMPPGGPESIGIGASWPLPRCTKLPPLVPYRSQPPKPPGSRVLGSWPDPADAPSPHELARESSGGGAPSAEVMRT
mmetsp:Transcript_40557/g.129276  ORF Transcript_40557/g.129276 Transcript_40557/m.129276 type:complete len:233 (-) Transcript_40557:3843-4541(-)